MNLTDDDTLRFQSGCPIMFKDICMVYSATLKEIIEIGYSNFQQYLALLTSAKPVLPTGDNELKQLIEQLSDFQYLLFIVTIDQRMNEALHAAFLFFTHEEIKISLDPPQIVIGNEEEEHILAEEDFLELQSLLKKMYFLEQDGEEITINPDDDPMTVKLKKQMLINREKVRRAKANKAQREKNELKFSDLIGSVTLNNCGLNMQNIWDITYYSFHDQLRRMGWRDQYNMNMQAAMAGAKIKKDQLKHWMRSIVSDQ